MTRLDAAGFADAAIADKALASAVAEHKCVFFAEKNTHGEVSTTRTSVDLTGPIDDARTVMYRLDADYTQANSFVNFENSRNALVAPSLTYHPTDRFQITVQGEYQNVRNVDSDPNFPAIGNRPAPIPTSTYLEDPGVTVSHPDSMEKKFFAYHWNYKLNDEWQITNRLAYNDLPEHVTNMYFASVSATGAGVNSLQYGPAGVQTFTTNLELAGKISGGGVQHQVLVGVDHLNFTEYFNGIYDYAAQNIDIFHPQSSYNTVDLASALDPANGNGFALLSKQRWNGVYAQDMIHLPDAHLHVLVGGRYDWSNTGSGIGFGNAAWSGAVGGFQQATDGGFSSRVGISLDLSPSMAAYANYSKALGLSNASTGVTVTGQPLSPQWSTQKELGLKGEFLNGRLSASTAYYDITLNDIPAAVPNTFGVYYLIGQARSRGFELDVTGKVNDSLSLIATFTHDLATVVSGYTTNFVNVPDGNRLPSVPGNMGSLWLKYSNEAGLHAWRVASGVTVVGQTQGDPANDFQIPGYAVVRAMAGYDFRLGTSKATVQLNIDNALNRTFFYGSTAYGNAYSLTPGTPRSAMGTFKLQF